MAQAAMLASMKTDFSAESWKEAWLAERMKERATQHNRNVIAVFVGETGIGKSWSALSLAERIDPNFSVAHVVFRAEDFLDLVNDGDLEPGAVVQWDETGLGMAAREWQSLLNKSVSYVLQSFRFRNLILLMTVPDQTFIDSQARRLFHYFFEMIHVNREAQVAVAKPFVVTHSARFDKDYTKYPVVTRSTGPVQMGTVPFRIPSTALREAYERKRRAFLDTYYRELRESMDATGGGGKDIPAWAWRLLLYVSTEPLIPTYDDDRVLVGFRPMTQAEVAGVTQLGRQWVNRLLKRGSVALKSKPE